MFLVGARNRRQLRESHGVRLSPLPPFPPCRPVTRLTLPAFRSPFLNSFCWTNSGGQPRDWPEFMVYFFEQVCPCFFPPFTLTPSFFFSSFFFPFGSAPGAHFEIALGRGSFEQPPPLLPRTIRPLFLFAPHPLLRLSRAGASSLTGLPGRLTLRGAVSPRALSLSTDFPLPLPFSPPCDMSYPPFRERRLEGGRRLRRTPTSFSSPTHGVACSRLLLVAAGASRAVIAAQVFASILQDNMAVPSLSWSSLPCRGNPALTTPPTDVGRIHLSETQGPCAC